MRHNARTDRNHKDLGRVARTIDPGAMDVHAFGAIGCDYIAKNWITKMPMFLEFKDPDLVPSERRLTENELAMQARYPMNYRVCMTIDDVRRALGVLRDPSVA